MSLWLELKQIASVFIMGASCTYFGFKHSHKSFRVFSRRDFFYWVNLAGITGI
jgi:hypothetical protein